jgi:pSer/pThr/pTyr-binding forkhead associated (FHA) protein
MEPIFVLKLEVGGQGFFLSLAEGVNDLGRSPDCDLQVQHHSISRTHARLLNTGESVWLDDLDSSKGTFVNGRRIGESVHLTEGDTIQFGDVAFKLIREKARPDTRASESLEFVASKIPEDALTELIDRE